MKTDPHACGVIFTRLFNLGKLCVDFTCGDPDHADEGRYLVFLMQGVRKHLLN